MPAAKPTTAGTGTNPGLAVVDAEPVSATGMRMLLARTGTLRWCGRASELRSGRDLIRQPQPPCDGPPHRSTRESKRAIRPI